MTVLKSVLPRWLAIAVLGSAMLSTFGCASLSARDPVEVYVVGVEPLQGAGLELRMNVKLRVQNPNETPITYNGISVNMNVQGGRFASGVSDASGTISRFGEAILDVPVSISVFRAARSAAQVFGPDATGKIQYELRGKLAGTAFNSVRFNSKGEFELPKEASPYQ
jgi:LEA14-like dessication related protein